MTTKDPASVENPIELGYLEEVDDSKSLHSIYFPSKIGGQPAWLSMQNFPDKSKFQCKICSQPMRFLLQVYAPDYDFDEAFHRSIFLFVCPKGSCNKENVAHNFLVVRCQLPRVNQFYGENAILDDDEADVEMEKLDKFATSLCCVCRCPADNRCSKCKKAMYCSRLHQVAHWKYGHKEECGGSGGQNSLENELLSECLFKEMELVTETEVLVEENGQPEKSDAEKMREFETYTKSLNLPVDQQQQVKPGDVSSSTGDLDLMSSGRADKAFKKFSSRLQQNPDQVLRYQRNGEPLWASDLTPNQVPACEICGAERTFEFQVMPQLLGHLSVDEVGASMDWATLAVYTCKKSCDIPDFGYSTEFLWKQDFSE